MSPACPLPMNSSARSRHWLAPGAVRNAGSEPDGFSFGRSAACSGPMRLDGPGSRRSSVAERTTIGRSPSLAGSTNAPTHVAPASSRTVSPGRARSSAACRSSPARTVMVAPATGVLQRTSNVPMKIAATARWPRRRVALCILLTSAVWRSVPHRKLLLLHHPDRLHAPYCSGGAHSISVFKHRRSAECRLPSERRGPLDERARGRSAELLRKTRKSANSTSGIVLALTRSSCRIYDADALSRCSARAPYS